MDSLKDWVFIISTADRPGATSAIASMFSGRGLQIDALLGYGENDALVESEAAAIAVQFKAFPDRMEGMLRRLSRLQLITSVKAYPYDNPKLLKSVTFQLKSIKDMPSDLTLLENNIATYCGPCTQADEIIFKLQQAGTLKTFSYHLHYCN